MPLAVIEPMVAGVPVIGTDVPGTRELVDGVGLLVPATPEGLAAGLDLVAAGPDLLARMAQAGRRRAEECMWPEIVERFQDENGLASAR